MPVLYLTVSVVSLIVETVKIVNLQGVPSIDLASEMEFGFPIETLGEKAYLITTHQSFVCTLIELFLWRNLNI